MTHDQTPPAPHVLMTLLEGSESIRPSIWKIGGMAYLGMADMTAVFPASRCAVGPRLLGRKFAPVQSTERSGNAQLTFDDAIHYNHGMRMERPLFDQGKRLLPEATQAEHEHMRRYNWLVREGHPTTVKADLACCLGPDWLLGSESRGRANDTAGPLRGGSFIKRAHQRRMVPKSARNSDSTNGSSSAVSILPFLP